MNEGKGFARRVTLENLGEFAPLLAQNTTDTHEGDAANRETVSDAYDPAEKKTDPALKNARAMFSGTPITTKKPPRTRASDARRPRRQTRPQEELFPGRNATGAPRVQWNPAEVTADFELVWESKPLARRDLTIPEAVGSNQTGSLNLDKGLLAEEIDHRHYFRDEVFSELNWTHRSGTVDEAIASFTLILEDRNHGDFELAVRHTTSTTSRSYEQRNAMTRLSWGSARQYIADARWIDRNLELYRSTIDPTRFILRIG